MRRWKGGKAVGCGVWRRRDYRFANEKGLRWADVEGNVLRDHWDRYMRVDTEGWRADAERGCSGKALHGLYG